MKKKEYKYLHMLGPSLYTKELYIMFHDDFDRENHIFATRDVYADCYKIDSSIEAVKSVQTTKLFSPRFFKLFYSCDGIILHGMFTFSRILFMFLNPLVWQKCNWIVWGGDLYIHRSKDKNMISKLNDFMKNVMIKHFKLISTVTEGDQDLVKSWFGYKGDFYSISYPIFLQREGLKERLCNRKNTNSKVINIVIGNSATKTNHHKEILDILKKYKNENIHIFLPLSYGNADWKGYAEDVRKYAEDIYGKEKVTVISNQMDENTYIEEMRKIHVAIYNNDRQQGMGNIAIMLACGSKVYIREDTTMWKHYHSLNQIMFSVTDILNQDFNQFIYYNDADRKKNFDVFFERNDHNKIVRKWKLMFEQMEKLKKLH